MPDDQQAERAVETLRQVLESLDLQAETDRVPGVFHIDFGPPHLPISTATVAVSQGQFVLYLNFGFLIEPPRRDEAARLIVRENWDLTTGNFDLDMRDGHLRFRSGVSFGEGDLTPVLIRNCIREAMDAVERSGPRLIRSLTPGGGP